MDPTLATYWMIALAASLVFLIQMSLTLIGLGDTDSGDMDMSSDTDTMDTGGAIQLFTIRNMVNFLLGVGWGGICFSSVVPNRFLLAVTAILCGSALVGAFMFMFRKMMRLEKNGAFRIEETQGQVCDVYLRIPASRKATGKIQFSFGGSIQELPAITDDSEEIPSGSKVRVKEIIDGRILVVERI